MVPAKGVSANGGAVAYAAHLCRSDTEVPTVAKPNYAFEKRQRELEKKRKKEDKAQRKQTQTREGPGDSPPQGGEAGAPATPPPAER